MNPHPVRSLSVSRSRKKKPSDPWNPSTTHGLLTPGRTTTSRHSRNQSCAGWPPAPVRWVCGSSFSPNFFEVGNPFWGGFLNETLEAMQFFLCLGDSEKMKWGQPQGLAKGKVFFWYTCIVHDIAVLIHAPIFVSQKRGGDVWVKCRNNCRHGHVTLSLLDTIVLPRYVGSSCSSLKCVNFAPWRNCT